MTIDSNGFLVAFRPRSDTHCFELVAATQSLASSWKDLFSSVFRPCGLAAQDMSDRAARVSPPWKETPENSASYFVGQPLTACSTAINATRVAAIVNNKSNHHRRCVIGTRTVLFLLR